jgi:sugar phosphate isomerase/epimerase
VLTRLGERVRLLHVKDGPAVSYDDDVMVPIGDGPTDWARVLATPSGVRWQLVELERLTVDVFEALERSYAYLTGAGLA